jgi:hypothetical protein
VTTTAPQPTTNDGWYQAELRHIANTLLGLAGLDGSAAIYIFVRIPLGSGSHLHLSTAGWTFTASAIGFTLAALFSLVGLALGPRSLAVTELAATVRARNVWRASAISVSAVSLILIPAAFAQVIA